MTKRDLAAEIVDNLQDNNLISAADRQNAIEIIMQTFDGFTIISNAYELREED